MTRDEWMASLEARPLFGDLPTTEHTNAIRYHLTSGTSGRVPIRVLDSMKDWEWIAEMWCYGFWAFGVRPADVVYFAFGYGSFIGFWGAHYCCEKIGALVIPGGAQTTEARVRQIVELGVTTVCSTPTYALRLWQQATEMGIDLRASQVNKVILSGEPAGSIRAVKAIVREYDAIDEFQIYIAREDGIRDEITIKLEVKPGREGEWEQLRPALATALANAHEGLRFQIELMPTGSLPRFELKAKRLVDARPVAAY